MRNLRNDLHNRKLNNNQVMNHKNRITENKRTMRNESHTSFEDKENLMLNLINRFKEQTNGNRELYKSKLLDYTCKLRNVSEKEMMIYLVEDTDGLGLSKWLEKHCFSGSTRPMVDIENDENLPNIEPAPKNMIDIEDEDESEDDYYSSDRYEEEDMMESKIFTPFQLKSFEDFIIEAKECKDSNDEDSNDEDSTDSKTDKNTDKSKK